MACPKALEEMDTNTMSKRLRQNVVLIYVKTRLEMEMGLRIVEAFGKGSSFGRLQHKTDESKCSNSVPKAIF
jgi:hypothetical protein